MLIPISDNIKLLGVTIDSSLALNKHVSLICQSCQYHIRALRHIRPILDAHTAKLVGHALVNSSQLSYVWHIEDPYHQAPAPTKHVSSRRPAYESSEQCRTTLLSELHWLPEASRIQFQIATLTIKILTTDKPSYLSSLLSHYQPTRQVRSSRSNFLLQPHSKTKFGFLHFSPLPLWFGTARQLMSGHLLPFRLSKYAQNSYIPQPSYLGHVSALRLRFVSAGPPRALSLRTWRVFQIVIIITSFPSCSSGVLDCLRPQLLKDSYAVPTYVIIWSFRSRGLWICFWRVNIQRTLYKSVVW